MLARIVLASALVSCGSPKTKRPSREDHVHSVEVHNRTERDVHVRFKLNGNDLSDDCHKLEDESNADVGPQASAMLSAKLSCRETPDGEVYLLFAGDETSKERGIDPRSGVSTVEITDQEILTCEGSPLRGAADADFSTALDFFGQARGERPDIGAVQGRRHL